MRRLITRQPDNPAEATDQPAKAIDWPSSCLPDADPTGAAGTQVETTDPRAGIDLTPYLAAIVDSSDDAIIGKDLDGIIISWNQGATKLFGYTVAEAIGNPITMLFPPDRHDEEPEILRRIRAGERIGNYDTVRKCKNGDLIDVSLTVSPVKNAAGQIIGASKIARDITERRRATAKQGLLLREMTHRVKNLFALANGIIAISARYASTPQEMAKAVEARLVALARAHDLTMPDHIDGTTRAEKQTDLGTLLRTIVSPYTMPTGNAPQDRISMTGPDIRIGGNVITSFALLLHEFTTNAAKYGSLSVPAGRVDVQWSVIDGRLHLEWCERDGPVITAPAEEEGFGSWIGRATVRSQLNGTMTRDWKTEGLAIQLVVPLDRLAG
jgi:PAS domain S-box-containing protein